MKTDELLKAYDAAVTSDADLQAFASLRGLTRDQVKAASEKYERLKRD